MQSKIPTLFACLAIVTVCHAETYTLKTSRPEKVGDKAEISAQGVNQMSQKATGVPGGDQEERTFGRGSLDAIREVLEVNAKGRPTKLKFTVKSLKYTTDKEAAPKEVLAGGKEIIAVRKGKKKSFTIDGKEAEEAMVTAIKSVISLGDEDDSADPDAMLNTKEPHAVGDEWDVNIDEMIKYLGPVMGLQFDRRASSGKVKLERVEKVDGVECGFLSASMNLAPSGMRGLPEGTDLTGSTFKVTLAYPYPTDPAEPERGGKITVKINLKAGMKTPDGGDINISIGGTMSHEESLKPIK